MSRTKPRLTAKDVIVDLRLQLKKQKAEMETILSRQQTSAETRFDMIAQIAEAFDGVVEVGERINTDMMEFTRNFTSELQQTSSLLLDRLSSSTPVAAPSEDEADTTSEEQTALIEDLRAVIDELNAKLRATTSDHEETLDLKTKELRILEQDIDELEEQNETLLDKVRSLEMSNDELEDELRKTKGELKSVRAFSIQKQESMEREARITSQSLERLQEEFELLNQRNEELEMRDSSKANSDSNDDLIAKHENEIMVLKNEHEAEMEEIRRSMKHQARQSLRFRHMVSESMVSDDMPSLEMALASFDMDSMPALESVPESSSSPSPPPSSSLLPSSSSSSSLPHLSTLQTMVQSLRNDLSALSTDIVHRQSTFAATLATSFESLRDELTSAEDSRNVALLSSVDTCVESFTSLIETKELLYRDVTRFDEMLEDEFRESSKLLLSFSPLSSSSSSAMTTTMTTTTLSPPPPIPSLPLLSSSSSLPNTLNASTLFEMKEWIGDSRALTETLRAEIHSTRTDFEALSSDFEQSLTTVIASMLMMKDIELLRLSDEIKILEKKVRFPLANGAFLQYNVNVRARRKKMKWVRAWAQFHTDKCIYLFKKKSDPRPFHVVECTGTGPSGAIRVQQDRESEAAFVDEFCLAVQADREIARFLCGSQEELQKWLRYIPVWAAGRPI